MGTDARLFAVKAKQSLYLDRLYNIPSNSEDPLRNSGVPVHVLRARIKLLMKGECYVPRSNDRDQGNVNRKPNLIQLEHIKEWLETLPGEEIVFVRSDDEDEYYDLMKKGYSNVEWEI